MTWHLYVNITLVCPEISISHCLWLTCWSHVQQIYKLDISGVEILTCIMYHMDHVMQLETVRMEPLNQFSWIEAAFPWIWTRGCHTFLIIGPLYSVIVVTPAKDAKVPRTFANPRGCRISTTSNLHSIQISRARTEMQ